MATTRATLTLNAANGIQIEQSFKARTIYWRETADAVADVFKARIESLD